MPGFSASPTRPERAPQPIGAPSTVADTTADRPVRLRSFIDHDMRAGAAILDQISLVGRDEKVARGNGDRASGEMPEGRSCVSCGSAPVSFVNSGDGSALGKHEKYF